MLRTSGLTDNIIFCTKWPEIGNAIKVYTQTGTTGGSTDLTVQHTQTDLPGCSTGPGVESGI